MTSAWGGHYFPSLCDASRCKTADMAEDVVVESRYADLVGRTAPPKTYDVERGHVAAFCAALGLDDGIYLDDTAARAAGYRAIVAPPTFAVALRPNDPRQGAPIDWTKLLHAEQDLRFARPIFVGDRLTVVATIEAATVKAGRSGVMDLLTVRTDATDADGAPVFTSRSTAAIRR